MKSSFLDKLIGRIDRIDPESLQAYMLKLVREKGFLETVFNTIEEGIIVTDAAGKISYLNRATTELLGIPATTGVGSHVSKYLPEMDWKKISSADREEWRKVLSRELEVFYPKQRLIHFYVMPLDDEGEQAGGLIIILRDITETQRKTEATIESEKTASITLLAAGVAHEIGNPLNSLHIHMQLLERELKRLPQDQTAKLREYVAVAKDEVGRLDTIVTQFLRAVRPARPNLEVGSINEVVREVVAFLKREITNRDILVEKELSSTLPHILFDRAQLKQAFFNIIKNAMHAMGKGGILHVSTGSTSDHVVVAFRDTGGGISEENLSKVFKPYFTTKEEGSGLGLMIVQRIVRDHGGEIEIESDVGRGTTVRILLPLRERRMRLLQAGEQGMSLVGDGLPHSQTEAANA
ncbi:MAG: PAS domain S-box protein [Verrucomicrobiae bacterium]|nr:PAS domain S-box protein [Verrucomicrobiae bacterium]